MSSETDPLIGEENKPKRDGGISQLSQNTLPSKIFWGVIIFIMVFITAWMIGFDLRGDLTPEERRKHNKFYSKASSRILLVLTVGLFGYWIGYNFSVLVPRNKNAAVG